MHSQRITDMLSTYVYWSVRLVIGLTLLVIFFIPLYIWLIIDSERLLRVSREVVPDDNIPTGWQHVLYVLVVPSIMITGLVLLLFSKIDDKEEDDVIW